MDAQEFGIVIQVNDLDSCRLFYRELLDLGEPIVDSTFLVVFQLHPNLTLTLEKTAATYLEHASGATCWRFEPEEFDALRRRLEEAGYELELMERRRGTADYWRGSDPEGNPFLVKQPLH